MSKEELGVFNIVAYSFRDPSQGTTEFGTRANMRGWPMCDIWMAIYVYFGEGRIHLG